MIKNFVDTTLNAKISEIKSEIPSITKLAALLLFLLLKRKYPVLVILSKKQITMQKY